MDADGIEHGPGPRLCDSNTLTARPCRSPAEAGAEAAVGIVLRRGADVTQVEERVGRIERETLRELAEEMLREQTGKRKGNQTACPSEGTAT